MKNWRLLESYFSITGIPRKSLIIISIQLWLNFKIRIRYLVYLNVHFILNFLGLVQLASHLPIKLPPRCIVVFMLLKLDLFSQLRRFLTPYILPIFNQSLLIYNFKCWRNSTYIGRTSQRLEVRVRQHVPQGILNSDRLTSGHSQALDSAISEHLTINSSKMAGFLFCIELGVKSILIS